MTCSSTVSEACASSQEACENECFLFWVEPEDQCLPLGDNSCDSDLDCCGGELVGCFDGTCALRDNRNCCSWDEETCMVGSEYNECHFSSEYCLDFCGGIWLERSMEE